MTPPTWFWRAYWPAAIAALLVLVAAPTLGPRLELALAPIRGPQSVQVVERTGPWAGPDGRMHGGRLCWDWTFSKLRDVWSDNIDAFLTINGKAGGVAAPYDRDNGRPWGIEAYAVPRRPSPYTLTYCVDLAPYVALSDSVMLRQTAFYPGFLGRWTLAVGFPDVESPGSP